MTDRDLYSDALAFVATLQAAGHSEAADRVRLAVEGGFTSTEILMGLRWSLDQFLDSDNGAEQAVREAALELRTAVDHTFRGLDQVTLRDAD